MFRGRSTLIYFVLALGLVCYLTFIDKKLPGTREQEESENELFKFDQDEATGLEITNVHGTFVFQKKGDHWEITSPVSTPADTPTVTEILGQIADTRPQRTIPIDVADSGTENNLKEWGLSPAAERVIIHLKDRSLELLIGRKIAINDSVYARTSSRKNAPVRIIPSIVKTVLQKGLSDFRSRSVFDFDTTAVTRVASKVANTATTPAQDCEIDSKNGTWTMQKPVIARASASDVQGLLAKFLALRVADFVTDDPTNLAQYGLTSPTATLSVTVSPDEEIVLQIGLPVPGKADQVYAQRLKSNAIFTLTNTAVNELLTALPNVRDHHILPFNPGKVTAVSFEVGPKKADLRRDKGLWNTVGASSGLADVGKVSDLLSRLSQLETTPVLKDSAPDLKPFGLDKPSGKITLTSPEFKSGTMSLSIGKAENHLLYVQNSTEPFIYTVTDSAFSFLGDNLSYRDTRAVNLILSQVKTMTITPRGKTTLVLSRSLGATWSAVNAKDRMVNSAQAETQASLICQLQARAWLGAPQPAYGLNDPVLTIALQTDVKTVLKVGAPLPDGNHAAQIEGAQSAFALSDSDYGLLNASSLELVPDALNGTNAPPAATNAVPSTNAAPAATEEKKSSSTHKKKKDAART
jgi:hypothetical protein